MFGPWEARTFIETENQPTMPKRSKSKSKFIGPLLPKAGQRNFIGPVLPKMDPKKSAPANTSRRMETRKPSIRKTSEGHRITHREFIQDVNGEDLFSTGLVKVGMNPGIMTPWLKNQAKGWEQYRYNTLKFYLISRRGTSSSGSVLAAIDYNPYDANPSTEAQMASYSGCHENSLYEDLVVNVDMKAYHAGASRKFVRDGVAPPGDLKTYDGGNLFISTVGSTDPGTVSHKLWVEYDVTFFVPETDATPLAVGFADLRNTAAIAIPQNAFSNVDTAEKVFDGLGLESDGKSGWIVPKGIYQFILNNSASFTDGGTGLHNVYTALRLLKNGATVAQSNAGGDLRDSSVTTASQLENTTLGCFSAETGDVITTQILANGTGASVFTGIEIPAFATRLFLQKLSG